MNLREKILTLSTVVWVAGRLCHYYGMLNTSLCIDAQVAEDVIQYLLLCIIMCHYITIKLCLELPANHFNIADVITNLGFTVLKQDLLVHSKSYLMNQTSFAYHSENYIHDIVPDQTKT